MRCAARISELRSHLAMCWQLRAVRGRGSYADCPGPCSRDGMRDAAQGWKYSHHINHLGSVSCLTWTLAWPEMTLWNLPQHQPRPQQSVCPCCYSLMLRAVSSHNTSDHFEGVQKHIKLTWVWVYKNKSYRNNYSIAMCCSEERSYPELMAHDHGVQGVFCFGQEVKWKFAHRKEFEIQVWFKHLICLNFRWTQQPALRRNVSPQWKTKANHHLSASWGHLARDFSRCLSPPTEAGYTLSSHHYCPPPYHNPPQVPPTILILVHILNPSHQT